MSRATAVRYGVAPSTIDRRAASGAWERLYPGVYRLAGAPESWRQRLLAACLAWGPGAVASHRAAAALWNLPGFGEGVIELTVPRKRTRAYGHTVHRPTLLRRADVTTLDAIPVTTPARTLLDLAGACPVAAVEEALDDALRRRLVSMSGIQRLVRAAATPGRCGVPTLRALIEARTSVRTPESVLETRLLRLLRTSRLPAPVTQHEVRAGGRLVARLDVAYPAERVAIEAEGFRWHSGRRRRERDVERHNALGALGWIVLRVTWEQLHERPDELVRAVRRALRPREG